MSQTPLGQPELNPYAPPVADVDAGAVLPLTDQNQMLAERGTRFVAQLLDGLLAFGAVVPFGIAFFLSDKNFWWLLGIVPFLLALSIYQWYLVATRGQTLGKGWMNIKIVKLDGSPVNFVSGVLLRNWVSGIIGAIPTVGMIFRLVDICLIFAADRRCIHDHIAGTKVIAA
jgi:uncharacterized RDD family membrane protein YckC